MGFDAPRADLDRLFDEMDVDRSGKLEFQELNKTCATNAAPKQQLPPPHVARSSRSRRRLRALSRLAHTLGRHRPEPIDARWVAHLLGARVIAAAPAACGRARRSPCGRSSATVPRAPSRSTPRMRTRCAAGNVALARCPPRVQGPGSRVAGWLLMVARLPTQCPPPTTRARCAARTAQRQEARRPVSSLLGRRRRRAAACSRHPACGRTHST